MTTTKRHLVGTFNKEQLMAQEDKIAIKKAQDETGLSFIDSKLNNKKNTMTVWLISNEEYLKSGKF
jgi:hypothetical protein